jgi:mannosyltransferase
VLLVTLSSLFFVKSIERPSTGNFAVYGLLSVLALYAHVYAVLVLASHWISLAFLKRCDVPWKGLVVSTGLVGVLTAPLGLLILERARHPYFPLGWLPKLSPHVVYDMFYALAGNADFPGSHGGKTILAAYVVVCFITLVSWLRIWWLHGRSFDIWRSAFVFSWLLVPFALATAVSLVQPMLMNRYLIICLPALVLLAAQGIRSIKPAWVSGMVLVVVLGLASLRLPQYYQHRARFQAWKTVTNYIVAKARPGDGAVFCVAPGRILFDYYREKDHRGVNLSLDILYPEPGDLRQDPRTLDYLPALNSSLLDSAAMHHSRMWVIVYHDTFAATEQARDRIEAALAAQYRDSQKTKFGGVTVILYSNGFVQREP